ncbi:unnamed protein product [Blepharisma stoltei]|uniref:Uncharacterized protein n=1 Tax=Blepharisma stoltei TaxID=1481888 RepID=A0AAU9JXJ3_9CILI|nr:unnamed protein product [Blepharisma stoltei]
MKCWKQDCIKESIYLCQCSEQGIYSCETHYIDHLQLNIQQRHLPQPLKFKPSQNAKQALCSYLKSRNAELNTLQSEAISKISQKIKKLNTQLKIAIDEITRVKKENQALIARIVQAEQISLHDDLAKILALDPDEAIEIIQDNICRIDIRKIPKYIECNLDTFDYSISGNEIDIFRDNSKMLLRVSLEDLTIKEAEIAMNQNTNTHLSICKISNSNLICIGGYNPYTSTAFMIYPDNSIKYLANLSQPCGFSSAIYYKNEVYAFGGYNNSGYVMTPEKYNISENIWKPLPKISVGANCCTGFVYKNKIFFAGIQHSKVYIYDIQQNSYSVIPIGLNPSKGKVLILNRNIFYVIESGSHIYEVGLNDLNWKAVGSCEPLNNYPVSHFVEFKNCIYFLNEGSYIYRFDLDSKSVLKLKKI